MRSAEFEARLRTADEQAAYLRELRQQQGWSVTEAQARLGDLASSLDVEQAERDGLTGAEDLDAACSLYCITPTEALLRPTFAVEEEMALVEYEIAYRERKRAKMRGVHELAVARADREIPVLRRRLLALQLQQAAAALMSRKVALEPEAPAEHTDIASEVVRGA